jgi:hypothetical protein
MDGIAEVNQFGCGACSAKKYGARKVKFTSDLSGAVSEYAVLRDLLARKRVKDVTRDETSKFGARRRRRSSKKTLKKAVKPKRTVRKTRVNKTKKSAKRRYGC